MVIVILWSSWYCRAQQWLHIKIYFLLTLRPDTSRPRPHCTAVSLMAHGWIVESLQNKIQTQKSQKPIESWTQSRTRRFLYVREDKAKMSPNSWVLIAVIAPIIPAWCWSVWSLPGAARRDWRVCLVRRGRQWPGWRDTTDTLRHCFQFQGVLARQQQIRIFGEFVL